MKKTLYFLAATAVLLVGCTNSGSAGETGSSEGEKSFGFVYKNTGNPFGEKLMEGFKNSIEEQGYTAITKAPDSPTAEQQINMIQELVAQGVDGIAISANDPDALQPALNAARDQGIQIISIDSAVNKESRNSHIQQADPVGIGRVLAESALEMAGGAGEIAILSATSTATNQNTWIEEMQNVMDSDEKYADLKIVKIAYGDDLRDKSTSETEALLQSYPDVKVIVAPSTVALAAAAKVVTDKGIGDKVKVTGLGLPSEMAEYIESDVTPYMYLWNPIDMGYLAGYTLAEMADGNISGEIGDTFDAGDLGTKEVTEAMDGGTEVLLGEPFKFDAENIDQWKDIF